MPDSVLSEKERLELDNQRLTRLLRESEARERDRREENDILQDRVSGLLVQLREVESEVERLRKFFERIANDQWGFSDVDGGDFQDYAVDLGLLVSVPANEQFKADWDAEEMYVLSWSPLAAKGGE